MTENTVWKSRTELLLGPEMVNHLATKHVLVLGLGGVGGICAEMIARAGVGEMTLVDADVVDVSNMNRQIVALHSTVGLPKAEVLAERLRQINPSLKLTLVKQFIAPEQVSEILGNRSISAVAECIDTLGPKVAVLAYCAQHKIPVVSSMGAGGKQDPGSIRIASIWDTKECTLAKYVRKRLRGQGISERITAVYSPEEIDAEKVIVTEKALPKKTLIGTISYMPALFGCTVAGVLVQGLMEGEG